MTGTREFLAVRKLLNSFGYPIRVTRVEMKIHRHGIAVNELDTVHSPPLEKASSKFCNGSAQIRDPKEKLKIKLKIRFVA